MESAICDFREGADWDLATSAEAVEQGAFAGGGGARVRVVQEFEMLTRGGVAQANFDAEGALSGGGAHDFGRNNVFDQFRFAQTIQSGGGEDDGVVFALLEFAQAGVDVAAQGMNVKVGADSFELRLAAQAAGADARTLRQFLEARVVPRAEGVARVLS